MEEILKQILDKVSGISHELTIINNRIDNLEYNIGEVNTSVKELKADNIQIKLAVLETNEMVKEINTKQDKQQDVIDILASRSIQQEAEIKRIK